VEHSSGSGYGLSESDIYSEILSYNHLKLRPASNEKFNVSNLLILQPLKTFSNNEHSTFEDTLEEFKLESSKPQSTQTPYFPETWFDEEFLAEKGGTKKFEMQVLYRQTSWRIQGISIHPTKGIAVTSFILEIKARKMHSFNIQSPPMTRGKEIFEIGFNITNLVKRKTNSKVMIKVENGDLMQGKNCTLNPQSTHSFDLSLPEENSKHNKFFLRSDEKDHMKVTITVDVNEYVDKAEKIIKLEAKKQFKQEYIQSILFDLNKIPHINKTLDINSNGSNYDVIFYGNLLDPLILRLEEIL